MKKASAFDRIFQKFAAIQIFHQRMGESSDNQTVSRTDPRRATRLRSRTHAPPFARRQMQTAKGCGWPGGSKQERKTKKRDLN